MHENAGKIDMKEMMMQYGYFGVCFYLVFILLMTFIVLNMFFTIMGDAFSITKEKISKEKNQYELVAFISTLICVSTCQLASRCSDAIIFKNLLSQTHKVNKKT